MRIIWLEHSALKIEGSRTIFIDPFLNGKPNLPENRSARIKKLVDPLSEVLILQPGGSIEI